MSLADTCALAQREMVEELRARGCRSDVLGAFERVPRYRFLDRFWSPPPGCSSSAEIREWNLSSDTDADAIELLHDPDIALAVHASREFADAKSTMSAPSILMSLLQMLDVEPGMSVLEIGTGTGYTAALIAELTGNPALVTSVETNSSLAAAVPSRLEILGYGEIEFLSGDGDLGARHRAPFDRIVATVGCADFSPSWLEQLTPDGFVVVPLLHGVEHPLVIGRQGDSGFVGRVFDRARFVPIQGIQARPMPERCDIDGPDAPDWRDLDAEIVELLARGDRGLSNWSFEYYLNLRSPERAWGLVLDDGDSFAEASLKEAKYRFGGPLGSELGAELREAVRDWIDLGRPTPMDYLSQWSVDEEPSHTADESDARRGPWTRSRIHYRQTTELDWGATQY